jgi:putative glutamine amidotransferase
VRPRIGITLGADVIAEYERAVREAGGEPVRLPPAPDRVDDDLRDLAGLVLSGGADVDPAYFGEPPHPAAELATPERDAYELWIARAAFERRLPTLAICRGIQVANVALGGSLVQHVPDVAGVSIPHAVDEGGRTYRGLIDGHVVATVAGSRFAALVGPSIVTGSRHHQALQRVADPLRVVGRTADGVIEAVEARDDDRFWLGVQWHPESTVDLDGGTSRAIFRALIAAATA